MLGLEAIEVKFVEFQFRPRNYSGIFSSFNYLIRKQFKILLVRVIVKNNIDLLRMSFILIFIFFYFFKYLHV
jgi:hypothetical protein